MFGSFLGCCDALAYQILFLKNKYRLLNSACCIQCQIKSNGSVIKVCEFRSYRFSYLLKVTLMFAFDWKNIFSFLIFPNDELVFLIIFSCSTENRKLSDYWFGGFFFLICARRPIVTQVFYFKLNHIKVPKKMNNVYGAERLYSCIVEEQQCQIVAKTCCCLLESSKI